MGGHGKHGAGLYISGTACICQVEQSRRETSCLPEQSRKTMAGRQHTAHDDTGTYILSWYMIPPLTSCIPQWDNTFIDGCDGEHNARTGSLLTLLAVGYPWLL